MAFDYDGGLRVVLVATPDAPTRLAEAVAAIGGRVVQQIDWHEAIAAGGHDAILLEFDGADDTAIVDMLARLDVSVIPVVVAFGRDRIDLAAIVFGAAVQWLCAPTDIECVAALAIAASQVRRPTRVAEGRDDAARIARLHAEIARIAVTLGQLAQGGEAGDHVADRPLGFAARPATVEVSAAEVRAAIRARRLRDRYFAGGLLEDPAWDMLLDLFAAELEGVDVSVSSLCIAAAVPPTTALRWIGRMTEEGLFARQADPRDRRRVFLALSPAASEAMRGYVAAVRSAGLSIG